MNIECEKNTSLIEINWNKNNYSCVNENKKCVIKTPEMTMGKTCTLTELLLFTN